MQQTKNKKILDLSGNGANNRIASKKKGTIYLNDLLDEDRSPNRRSRNPSENSRNLASPTIVSPIPKDASLDDSMFKYHNAEFQKEYNGLKKSEENGKNFVPKTVIFTSADTPFKTCKLTFLSR